MVQSMGFFLVALLSAFPVARAATAMPSNDEVCAAGRRDAAQGAGMIQLPTQRKLLQDTQTSSTDFRMLGNGPPCTCDKGTVGWKLPERKDGRCVFIDLGANNGNTFHAFLTNQLNNAQTCANHSGNFQAHLVEANPKFDIPLQAVAAEHAGKVTSFHSHAAYMCESRTSFHLDAQAASVGSSMADNKESVKDGVLVTVPTMNVLKMVFETIIPEDNFILKMDIEGAEWDILPCLAQVDYASKIDTLLVEIHNSSWGKVGTNQDQMSAAIESLKAKGVNIPKYHSLG